MKKAGIIALVCAGVVAHNYLSTEYNLYTKQQ